jgi:hypothetical protein
LATVVFALLAAPTLGTNAGFEEITIANGGEGALTIGAWYPIDAPETEQRLAEISQNVALFATVAGQSLPLVLPQAAVDAISSLPKK